MDLEKQKEQKIARQQSILDTAKNQKRDLTQEEQKELETLQKEIDTLIVKTVEQEKANQEINLERQRVTEILALCREYDIAAEDYIKDGKTIEQVKGIILEKLKKKNPPLSTKANTEVTIMADEQDKFRAAAADGLLLRGGIKLEKTAEGASELANMTLRDLAIESLQRTGETNLHRKSSNDLFDLLCRAYYNPSSAFPAIMDQAIEKAYTEGHKNVPVTYDQWIKKGTLNDFKKHDNYYLSGPAGEFLEVPEGGELKHDIWTDEKRPQRQLKTYGRQFTMTRQAFINDDVDCITKLPAKYAASARKTQNKQVYKILIENPAIYDGTPLFSAAHKNILTSGSGITAVAVQKMIMALQTQLDEFGEPIIVNPACLIVPTGYAFDMYTLFNSPVIHTTDNTQAVNPLYAYREKIKIIEEPTINVLAGGNGNVMPWFLLGSSFDTDFMEIDYLGGKEIPNIRRMETPGTLGFVWDIYLDWGITVMDYRGAIKNPGITINFEL